MKFIVFDFETNGVGKDKKNNYNPYPSNKMPLPRANFPVQLCAKLIDENGTVINTLDVIINGAERLDPWVQENCSHLSIEECNRTGIIFSEMLTKLSNMIPDDDDCTLVAHNIQYDWNDVILFTVIEQNLEELDAFVKLQNCQKFCTCINDKTLASSGLMKAYFFKKISKWIGPSLENLAKYYNIEYDHNNAHDAQYDVDVTIKCFLKMNAKN